MSLTFIEIEIGDLRLSVSNDYYTDPCGKIYYPRLKYHEAIEIAHANDADLATPKLEDIIWQKATVKLPAFPKGAPYDSSMDADSAYEKISSKILAAFPPELMLNGLPDPSKEYLAAGHKKIMCLSNSKNLAIYGWHGKTGKPIQGLNTSSHNKAYSDYSQSARFVKNEMFLSGQSIRYRDVLQDKKLYKLISNQLIRNI